ncbi:hypothetical protein FNL55_13885 [Tardiphaga sp. vice352]|uniref:hypothetical protein n=1 Tax=unclassified Tardiphaga TaxID=2631404 RepID=UPI0011637BEE|nr:MULTISPECIES: hypothetical protein [unclassified Tardiphaga]MBC7583708.1 hypothetical protein [Tardiphaga sp.]QDM16953.1 hypothetical protein FNL53_14165 [Tardiphaga sp. vice278]QDM21935.1 hypothetical protein FIU28_12830 [Tardiphaga sp. vice154]QDM27189.1 hypothetical protein FNL56_14485 [Tardiphaga sp. vice304]QDM32314.1 hypothetical protein FNL55_13885 [Tardiphaga sp. vice352]
MTEEITDVAAALKVIPVSWLHQPRLALTIKGDGPAPKVAPLVLVAIGVATGAGIQLAGQALRKAPPEEQKRLVDSVECNLSIDELERNARGVVESMKGSKGGPNELLELPEPGAKVIPVPVVIFLAGVAAGAAAARP